MSAARSEFTSLCTKKIKSGEIGNAFRTRVLQFVAAEFQSVSYQAMAPCCCGSAAVPCGKALPFRPRHPPHPKARLRLAAPLNGTRIDRIGSSLRGIPSVGEAEPRLPLCGGAWTERPFLTAQRREP